jgi:hypothetical protein
VALGTLLANVLKKPDFHLILRSKKSSSKAIPITFCFVLRAK